MFTTIDSTYKSYYRIRQNLRWLKNFCQWLIYTLAHTLYSNKNFTKSNLLTAQSSGWINTYIDSTPKKFPEKMFANDMHCQNW